jgi:hypothetical protein
MDELTEAQEEKHPPGWAGAAHNSTDEYRCTECGHTSRDFVPGCTCCGTPERHRA